MRRMPQPIPYQGSKRAIADAILQYLPLQIHTLHEPFAGSAALSIRAAYLKRVHNFRLNDLNKPLARLLELIIDSPVNVADEYAKLWHSQIGREREYYDLVRSEFNQTQDPIRLLYLLARCVKSSVRYNNKGEFNQGPDNRRRGRTPDSMRRELVDFSRLLHGRTQVSSCQYDELYEDIDPAHDFVYMDPPYQGTSTNRDPRYFSQLNMQRLIKHITILQSKHVMFALSFDGRKGDKVYGESLPSYLGLAKVEICAGRSTQSTLLGQNHMTFESLYLSSSLASRLADVSLLAESSTDLPIGQLTFAHIWNNLT